MDPQQVQVEAPKEPEPAATTTSAPVEPKQEEPQVQPLVPRIPPNATIHELIEDRKNLNRLVINLIQTQVEPARVKLQQALASHSRLNKVHGKPMRVRVRSGDIEVEWMGDQGGLEAARALAKSAVDDAMRYDQLVRQRHKSYMDAMAETNKRIIELTEKQEPEPAAPAPQVEAEPSPASTSST